MGLSCFRAISGIGLDWVGMGWDLCAGLFYEHRFAMLITKKGLRYRNKHRNIKNCKKLCPFCVNWPGRLSPPPPPLGISSPLVDLHPVLVLWVDLPQSCRLPKHWISSPVPRAVAAQHARKNHPRLTPFSLLQEHDHAGIQHASL